MKKIIYHNLMQVLELMPIFILGILIGVMGTIVMTGTMIYGWRKPNQHTEDTQSVTIEPVLVVQPVPEPLIQPVPKYDAPSPVLAPTDKPAYKPRKTELPKNTTFRTDDYEGKWPEFNKPLDVQIEISGKKAETITPTPPEVIPKSIPKEAPTPPAPPSPEPPTYEETNQHRTFRHRLKRRFRNIDPEIVAEVIKVAEEFLETNIGISEDKLLIPER